MENINSLAIERSPKPPPTSVLQFSLFFYFSEPIWDSGTRNFEIIRKKTKMKTTKTAKWQIFVFRRFGLSLVVVCTLLSS